MSCPILGAINIPWLGRAIVGTLNTITSFTSIVGNAYIVFIIFYYPKLRRRTNFLLTVLAVTDFGVGLIAQPLVSAQLFNPSIGASCSVTYAVTYLSAVFCGASSWILALISYDRYLRMVKLKNYNLHMSEKRLIALACLCWLYPISFPIMMFFNKLLDAYYALLIASAFVTMTLIFFFYFMSWRFVKTKSKIIPKSESSNTLSRDCSQKKVAHHWRMAKTIAIVIACYVLAWMPMTLFLVFQLFWRGFKFDLGEFNNYVYMIYYITLFIGYSNSSVNPVIYYWRNKELHREMRRFFFKRVLRREEHELSMSGTADVST